MSSPVTEGFTKNPVLPTSFVLEFDNATPAKDSTSDWFDVVNNAGNDIHVSSNLSTQALFNDSPAKIAVVGETISLLVPGVYSCTLSFDLWNLTGGSAAEIGMDLVDSATGVTPDRYLQLDYGTDSFMELLAGDTRSITRTFLVDIEAPQAVSVMCVDRKSGSTANLRIRSGQISFTRLSDYVAVTRT